MKLEVTSLRSGTRLIRPDGSIGTCGFYPKGWQCVVFDGGDVVSSFLAGNKNWSKDDVTGVVWDLT